MNDYEFSRISNEMLGDIKERTPRDTGNLQDFATLKRPLHRGQFEIYIDEKVAPYFKYVNNYPRLANGKINPNCGYFQEAIEKAVSRMAERVGGTLIRD